MYRDYYYRAHTSSAIGTPSITSTGGFISPGNSQSILPTMSGKELEDDFPNMRKKSFVIKFFIQSYLLHNIVIVSTTYGKYKLCIIHFKLSLHTYNGKSDALVP